jgi:hypothetical protein
MLSEKQMFILNKNNVYACERGGYWSFTVNGQTPRQKESLSKEGALKKAIGYLMNGKR